MWIDANDYRIRYCGRIDWKNPTAPVWVYPCTSAEFQFTGEELRIYVKNQNEYWNNSLGCILDGMQSSYDLDNEKENRIEITVPKNETGIHKVLFFKRQDSCHEITILGYEIQEGEKLLPLTDQVERRIEVYGDSVSAGEVSEAVEYVGQKDPVHKGEYSNSWYSFAWMTARKLNAQIHDIAQGGIALLDGQGWFHEPNQIGMETIWNKVRYSPQFGEMTEWNFNHYVPQIVIVAIGQNDSHPVDYMKDDYEGKKAVLWRKQYGIFLRKLRKRYPDTQIVCCTTLLQHDENWDRSITQVVQEMKDSKITQYIFKRNGKGTPGHLRISEAQEMADELAEYIQKIQIKDW